LQKKSNALQAEKRSSFFTEEDLKKVFLFPDKEKTNTKYERGKYGKNIVSEKSLSWKRKK
jgi:hypothetical protein